MNFWGFTPAIFGQMTRYFADFLRLRGSDPDAECYLPDALDRLIRSGEAECRVLKTDGAWFGITHAKDNPVCVKRIRQLIAAGVYAERLWG